MSLKVPHQRPQRLSDPYHDHGEDYCKQVLTKPDEALDWSDYQALLGPFLPAGAYEESIYFLPLAFDYLATHEENAFDLVDSPIWFISEFEQLLRRDGILVAARDRMAELLLQWASTFRVEHCDRIACAAKGFACDYYDYVLLSQEIDTAIQCLIRFETHADLAIQFFAGLADHRGNPIKAAWFLELIRFAVQDPKVDFRAQFEDDPAKSSYSQYLNRYSGVDPNTTAKSYASEAIRELMTDRKLIDNATAVVKNSDSLSVPSPTYWNDTLRVIKGL